MILRPLTSSDLWFINLSAYFRCTPLNLKLTPFSILIHLQLLPPPHYYRSGVSFSSIVSHLVKKKEATKPKKKQHTIIQNLNTIHSSFICTCFSTPSLGVLCTILEFEALFVLYFVLKR